METVQVRLKERAIRLSETLEAGSIIVVSEQQAKMMVANNLAEMVIQAVPQVAGSSIRS